VHIFDYIHQRRKLLCHDSDIAQGGLPVVQWTFDHGILTIRDSRDVWYCAGRECHIQLPQWLFDNGFTDTVDAAHGAAFGGHMDALFWCRQHGMQWNSDTCSRAASAGQFSTLKWLRENDCPWDSSTIAMSQLNHPTIAHWARENGCPEPSAEEDT